MVDGQLNLRICSRVRATALSIYEKYGFSAVVTVARFDKKGWVAIERELVFEVLHFVSFRCAAVCLYFFKCNFDEVSPVCLLVVAVVVVVTPWLLHPKC